MRFQFPWFLLALITLLIPIILHLYNNRKHPRISFSHLFFFERKEIQSKKAAKIKKKILLTLRVLALLSIILAFALPFFSSSTSQESHTLPIVFLDQNPSMSLDNEGEVLFERMKSEVIHTLNQMEEQDQVVMISTLHPRSFAPLSKNDAIQWVKELSISQQFLPISFLQSNIEWTEKELSIENAPLYIFSNFQRSLWNADTLSWPEHRNIDLVQYSLPQKQNYYIDTAWVKRDEKAPLLQFHVGSHRAQVDSVRVQLYINDRLFQSQYWNLKGEQLPFFTLPFLTETAQLSLIVEDPQVSFDDTLRMVYTPEQFVPISLITSSTTQRFYKALAHAAPLLMIHPIEFLDMEEERGHNEFVIYEATETHTLTNQALLKQFVEKGGVVFWIPSYDISEQKLESLLTEWSPIRSVKKIKEENQVQRVDRQHPVFREIIDGHQPVLSLPKVFEYYQWQFSTHVPLRPVMYYADGNTFLYELTLGEGKVYFLTSPLDPRANNFSQNYLFAPFMYALVMQHQTSWPLYLTNEKKQELFIPFETKVSSPWHIKSQNIDFIPEQIHFRNGKKILFPAFNFPLGYYQLTQTSDDVMYSFSYNLSSKFSELNSLEKEELKVILGNGVDVNFHTQVLSNKNEGFKTQQNKSEIWVYLLILGLLFLLIDVWMTYKDPT